ncbi:acylphosphatase [Schauerella aestuarii]|uniref:acylphosphatase n=1 Tax=Schauerella aestuarii TaxID=2511204 RepID=UPI00136C8286|nr:acylphosphatase [Achromobacter aestuarii]MYZ42120.1 acylphosphatase [Achromobacter aestuarii]
MALPDPNVETVSVHVTGRVQGVGYRAFTVRHARLVGAYGWVLNDEDGTVRAMVQGTPDQVDRMLEFMRRGPPGAFVRELTSTPEYIDRRFARFEQH